MFFVISYDIKDNKKRYKVCNILKDYGNRVQYSVFECELDKKLYDEMIKRILPYIDEEDSLRIYYLCKDCKAKIIYYGTNKIINDNDIFIF